MSKERKVEVVIDNEAFEKTNSTEMLLQFLKSSGLLQQAEKELKGELNENIII